ncbi:MAG: molybdate ABC transporter substrate-binding protein [Candidatus Baltobacteraceae bacterium]|jgi:molybdate transport system substrate-binding protein
MTTLFADAPNRRRVLGALLAFAAAVPLAVCGRASAAQPAPPITVFAAASLHEAFTAAAPAFTAKTGIAVVFDFAGSDTLETQIAAGAPADVFASANQAQMKKAGDAGLLAGDPQVFARNRLVVIVPKDDPAKIASPADLGRKGVKLVLAAPTVPVGNYARVAFANLAKLPGYGADFAARVEANAVSEELDVKAVATKVALGEADAGVVYATDVTPALAGSVQVLAFPPDSAPEAVYPIAVVRASKNADAARAFVTFVLSPEGQSYLKARGFIAGS